MTDVRITVDGLDKVDRLFSEMQTRSDDYMPVLQIIEREQAMGEGAIFGSQGAAIGGWAPLSPLYAAWKLAHFGALPIMVRTGNLMESLTGAPMRISRIGPKEAVLGTDVSYAHWHQEGTSRMPQRKIVAVLPGMSSLWARQVGNWVVKGL